jgi:hypothetical protein
MGVATRSRSGPGARDAGDRAEVYGQLEPDYLSAAIVN